jgi:hypothetical protein
MFRSIRNDTWSTGDCLYMLALSISLQVHWCTHHPTSTYSSHLPYIWTWPLNCCCLQASIDPCKKKDIWIVVKSMIKLLETIKPKFVPADNQCCLCCHTAEWVIPIAVAIVNNLSTSQITGEAVVSNIFNVNTVQLETLSLFGCWETNTTRHLSAQPAQNQLPTTWFDQ